MVNRPNRSPRVSVIVPCYQSERTLDETLRSVRRQTMKDWECIIVNDGSTDGTAAIAARWVARDGRFQILTQENRGLAAARNAGLVVARGEFVQFLDSDDLLYPHSLAAFLDATRRHEATVHYTGFHVVDAQGKSIGTRKSPDVVDYSVLCQGNAFSPHSAIVRRADLQPENRFDESISPSADWGFWLGLARSGKTFVKAGEALVVYRSHPGQMSQDLRRMYHADRVLLQQHVLPWVVPGAELPARLSPASAGAAVVKRWLTYFGWAIASAQWDAFEEVLRDAREVRVSEVPDPLPIGTLIYGLHVGTGDHFSHKLRDLLVCFDLSAAMPSVERIERELGWRGLVDELNRKILDECTLLAREQRRTLTSRSFRLAQKMAGFSGWMRRCLGKNGVGR